MREILASLIAEARNDLRVMVVYALAFITGIGTAIALMGR